MAHMKVWRQPKGKPFQYMWIGECDCGEFDPQYWSWGATLGAMLHHSWKVHNEA